jgi:hypothetical protein
MQEEVDQQILSLCFTGGRISAELLRIALSNTLKKRNVLKKGNIKEQTQSYKGKHSLKDLKKTGAELTNIEITDDNIKQFEKCARKYNVDYCLKKDKGAGRYYVFFKSRDVDSMTSAFREYTRKEMTRKGSVRKKLNKAVTRAAEISRNADKKRHRERHRQRSEVR